MRRRYAVMVMVDDGDELTQERKDSLRNRGVAAFPEAARVMVLEAGWASTDTEPAGADELAAARSHGFIA